MLAKRFHIQRKMMNLISNKKLNFFGGDRRKRPPIDGWGLNDVTFDILQKLYSFTVERLCDSSGLNGHKNLPYFDRHSLLDHDVSSQSAYCNPPWSLAIEYVEHLRACHSNSRLDTRAVIVLLAKV